MADKNPDQYQRLTVDEIQELAGEPLPERVALSLFRAGVGTPMPFLPADDVIPEPIKTDGPDAGIPPGESV